jgi:AraC family transcriptional regulator, transcriptional activator of pobA
MGKSKIPVYSINQFKKDQVRKKQYQVELFDRNRNFQVEYPHRHDNFYEILLITRGSGTYTIDFQSYPIGPERIFFVSPGQVHTIDYSEDISGYIFLFTSEFYQLDKTENNRLAEFPFFHNFTEKNPPLAVADSAQFIALFELACRETASEHVENENIARGILDVILHLCKKQYPVRQEETKIRKGNLLVKKFRQQIEMHYHKNFSVQEYADLLSVTASHLNETIKEITGQTAKEHIKERQILEIKRMLSHTDLNVSEIAYQLGFEDQSYFSRFFRKNTGLTPNEFRGLGIR